jgi:LCP family protein required for cell wall assembly
VPDAVPPRRRRIRLGRVVALCAGLVAVAGIAAGGARVLMRRRAGEGITQSVATSILGAQPTNILLIGNNARQADSPLTPGQADLLFVLHIDPVHHQVVFISIPRNVMIAYPSWNDPVPKIKGAFFMGGPALATRKVSELLGMPIQYYVVSDFSGFERAINAIGGLNVDVQQPIFDPTHSHAEFAAGVQHMDGAQLLAYVRVRQNAAGNTYRTNDFQRMDAAYGVLASIRSQALAHLGPGALSTLFSVWRQDVATNLTQKAVVGLAFGVLHATWTHVTIGSLADSMVLPPTALPGVNAEGRIDGAYYDIVTRHQILASLAPYGSRDPRTGLAPLPAPSTVAVEVSGNDAALVSRLRRAGLRATAASLPAAPGATLVLYPEGDLPAAEVVGRALGQSNEQLEPAAVGTIEVEPGN